MKIFRLPTIYMVGGETHNITLNIKNSCFNKTCKGRKRNCK